MNEKPDYLTLVESPLLSIRDQEDAIRRAQQRAIDRVEEREHLRLELKARQYIHTVHGVIDTLVAGAEPERMYDGRPKPGGNLVPLDRTRIQALKTAMDGSLRLLDRVLPPLKAIELQDSPERAMDPTKLTTSELLKMVMKASHTPAQVEGETIIEEEDQVTMPWE